MSSHIIDSKKYKELSNLIQKHDNEIVEQENNIEKIKLNILKIENQMKQDFKDVYNSPNYKRIWNNLKVDINFAKKELYNQNYKNPITYKNRELKNAYDLLKSATEKKLQRIDQINSLFPKLSKSANFKFYKNSTGTNTKFNSKDNRKSKSNSPVKKSTSKGGAKKNKKKTRKRKTKHR